MSSGVLFLKHKEFFKECLRGFPDGYETLDTTRLTLLFFCVSGLDILNGIEDISEERKTEIIDWIYKFQLTTKNGLPPHKCGFTGWPVGTQSKSRSGADGYDSGHLAMTYSAICCLLILGDDLTRLDRLGICANMRACQLPDGSFCAHPGGSENDARFIYCAAAISYIINDWGGFNKAAAIAFLKTCINFDGAFGQLPKLESHGGSTYCALAALRLMGEMKGEGSGVSCGVLSGGELGRLRRWCVMRQNAGFHGRTNKPDDSCYTFWIGASLNLLGWSEMVDGEKVRDFTLSTQNNRHGGFGKYSDSFPDALHSYLSLAGLSLLKESGLRPLHPALNITLRAFSRLPLLHASFSSLLSPSPTNTLNPTCCTES